MEGAELKPKRVPAKEKFISEINGSETRVCFIASVIANNEEGIIVSDATAEAVLKPSRESKKLKEAHIYRIIARPVSVKPLLLELELAQELKDFDSNLYKKVKEFWSKI